jgi:flagellar motility protein MotE (MotC chaperone)
MLWFLHQIYEKLGAESLDSVLAGSSDAFEKLYAQEVSKTRSVEKMHNDFKEVYQRFEISMETSNANILRAKDDQIASLLLATDALSKQNEGQRRTIEDLRERLGTLDKIMQSEYETRQTYRRQLSGDSNAKKIVRLARIHDTIRSVVQ